MRSHDPSYAERACTTETETTRQPTAAAQVTNFFIVCSRVVVIASVTDSQLVAPLAESTRHSAGFRPTVGTVRIDVQRTCSSLDHLARDDDFLDAFQAREVEHGLDQAALQDRTQ